MSTTKLIAFLIAVMLVLVLGACQSETPSTDKDSLYGNIEDLDPTGVLVVYWHALSGADQDRFLEMIDDFNTGNEWDITVVGEYQGNLQTLSQRVIAGVPSNQLPSLVMTDLNFAAAYAAQDIAVALAPYLESENWGLTPTNLEDFYPSALGSDQLRQFDNQTYSFPSCRSLQVLYYNESWLKELGYDAPPQTWSEFREMACTASQPTDGLFGFELGMDSSIFTNMLATQDTPLLGPNAKAYTLGDEQGRAVLRFLQELINDSCAIWETEEGIVPDFGTGNILFTIDSTGELPIYRFATEGASFTWTLSSLPHTTDEPVVGVYGVSTTILRSTPEEQLAAWLFIRWLAEPAQQARWAQNTNCFPIRRSALGEMEAYLAAHPQYSMASQFLEYQWVTEPGVTAHETCRTEIGRMLYAVTAGESAEQWFSDTLNLCNQAFTDNRE